MLISELRRAFSGWGFWTALALGCTIAIAHIVQFVIPEFKEASAFPPAFPLSVFSRWMGGWSYPVHPALFYFIMPILAALPFGWSLFADVKNGYCVQKAARASWGTYLRAKFIATFLSGGVVVVIPLVVNFLGTACVFPLIQPDPTGIGTFMIYPYSFAAELFFSNAALYCLFYVFVNFASAGMLACVALVFGLVMPSGALATLSPFIICTVVAQALKNTSLYSLVPTLFCMPGQDYGVLDPTLLLVFFAGSLLLVACGMVCAARGDYLE